VEDEDGSEVDALIAGNCLKFPSLSLSFLAHPPFSLSLFPSAKPPSTLHIQRSSPALRSESQHQPFSAVRSAFRFFHNGSDHCRAIQVVQFLQPTALHDGAVVSVAQQRVFPSCLSRCTSRPLGVHRAPLALGFVSYDSATDTQPLEDRGIAYHL
jgi:hypothetical protein